MKHPERIDLYCVMGNPVEHSKSPWIHARFAELTDQSLRYDKRLVPIDAFEDGIEEFMDDESGNARGCNVTVPFKLKAAQLARHATERVTLAQAANLLIFKDDGIHADNTDGMGLVRDIKNNAGVPILGKRVLLIGAGGAAAGALAPLIEARPSQIVIANRTLATAIALVDRHKDLADYKRVPLDTATLGGVDGSFDIVINASSSSLSGDEVPVSSSVLSPGALALDMMYGASAEGFMQWATEHGAIARDGLGMLVEQAAISFTEWRGVEVPSMQVLDELRASLKPQVAS